ncbi:MAG: DUF4870 domain-containing protein [Lachnospiraceae bacterium]|nr:DUF4870 domain-containing protein [Lachnospiraceae bacterium]
MADFNEQFNKFNDTPDTTSEFEAEDIEKNKVMAVLAYIGILVLVPIFAAKDSKFARFHANQGLVLAIAEIVGSIVLNILSGIPVIGLIFSIISGLFGLVCLLFAVLGIVNAANGKAKELPLVGKFRFLK